jgi:Ca2+-binding RTX toxin-like protein
MATIIGTPDNDVLIGTEENDYVEGGAGNDFMFGAGGNDELRGGAGNDLLIGGEGDDTLAGDEFVFGQPSGDDLLIAGSGNDVLASLGGNDTLIAGQGDDRLDLWATGPMDTVIFGGQGEDSLTLIGAHGVLDLRDGTFVGATGNGAQVSMSVQGVERFTLFGDPAGSIVMIGDSADNYFEAGNSNDTLNGGAGNDTLFGMAGNDWYVFDAVGEANADSIEFQKNPFELDEIALDRSAMSELGAAGELSVDDERFHAAAGASGGAEADDRVIYDTEAGRLYYDADGSGAGEAQLIATLAFPVDLAATDITVI